MNHWETKVVSAQEDISERDLSGVKQKALPHKDEHDKDIMSDEKPQQDDEKVIPDKEIKDAKASEEPKEDSAPDATVKISKEATAELDAKDGHRTDLSTIKIGNFSQVTSQERDIATISALNDSQSVLRQQTTFISVLPTLISPEFNEIRGTRGSDGLIGTLGNDQIFGLDGNDVLLGLAGNDVLDGGPGRDLMIGGLGNDSFYVDDVSDLVYEKPNEGNDIVFTTVSFSLDTNLTILNAVLVSVGIPPAVAANGVENLTALGSANINLTGNALDNIINGNSGANIIDGGTGADTMAGGLGNDIYIVNNINDKVIEKPSEGNDTVFTNVNFTLSDNVESLLANGGAVGVNLTGNSGNNFIAGAQGNDVLVGGLGSDTFAIDLNLAGGFGSDKFNDFTVLQNDILLFRGVVDSGAPGLNIDDVLAMQTAAVSHPNGTDTQFTFATGSVTLVGINVSNLDDPSIASQVVVQA